MKLILAALLLATAIQAQAAPCAATAGVTAAPSVTGGTMRIAGMYAIENYTTGAMMLGWPSGGGILAGTAGVIGTVGAVLMSPFVIASGLAAAGTVALLCINEDKP